MGEKGPVRIPENEQSTSEKEQDLNTLLENVKAENKNKNKETLDGSLNRLKENNKKKEESDLPNKGLLTTFLRSKVLRTLFIGGITLAALLPKESGKKGTPQEQYKEYARLEGNEGKVVLEKFREAKQELIEFISSLKKIPEERRLYEEDLAYNDKVKVLDELQGITIKEYSLLYIQLIEAYSTCVDFIDEKKAALSFE